MKNHLNDKIKLKKNDKTFVCFKEKH